MVLRKMPHRVEKVRKEPPDQPRVSQGQVLSKTRGTPSIAVSPPIQIEATSCANVQDGRYTRLGQYTDTYEGEYKSRTSHTTIVEDTSDAGSMTAHMGSEPDMSTVARFDHSSDSNTPSYCNAWPVNSHNPLVKGDQKNALAFIGNHFENVATNKDSSDLEIGLKLTSYFEVGGEVGCGKECFFEGNETADRIPAQTNSELNQSLVDGCHSSGATLSLPADENTAYSVYSNYSNELTFKKITSRCSTTHCDTLLGNGEPLTRVSTKPDVVVRFEREQSSLMQAYGQCRILDMSTAPNGYNGELDCRSIFNTETSGYPMYQVPLEERQSAWILEEKILDISSALVCCFIQWYGACNRQVVQSFNAEISDVAQSAKRDRSKPSSKRKRAKSSKGGQEDSDDGDETSRKRARPGNKPQPQLRFACPFYKRDPEQYHYCQRYEIQKHSHVVQHIRRQHLGPTNYCSRCSKIFVSQSERDQHIRVGNCLRRPLEISGVTQDQLRDIVALRGRRIPDSERWYWDILFPHIPRPNSPYLQNGPLEWFSFTNSFLREFGSQTLGDVLRDMGINALSSEQTEDVMRQFLERSEQLLQGRLDSSQTNSIHQDSSRQDLQTVAMTATSFGVTTLDDFSYSQTMPGNLDSIVDAPFGFDPDHSWALVEGRTGDDFITTTGQITEAAMDFLPVDDGIGIFADEAADREANEEDVCDMIDDTE
jgi:hypothetical protein